MRLLFLGGTGNISTCCVEWALTRGHEVAIFNRGRRPSPFGPRVTALVGDRDQPGTLRQAAEASRWDAVLDFVAFTPAQVDAAVLAFAGRVGQYVFISSASAYQKPPARPVITEDTPLANPFWEYARQKIACEERLRAAAPRPGVPGHDRAALLHVRPHLDPLRLRRPGLHGGRSHAARPADPLPRRRHVAVGHDPRPRLRRRPRGPPRPAGARSARPSTSRATRSSPGTRSTRRWPPPRAPRPGSCTCPAPSSPRSTRTGAAASSATRPTAPSSTTRRCGGSCPSTGPRSPSPRASPSRSPGSTRTPPGGPVNAAANEAIERVLAAQARAWEGVPADARR